MAEDRRTCPTCNNLFYPKKLNQVYCSFPCVAKRPVRTGTSILQREAPKLIKICPNCCKEFVAKRSFQVYCTTECREVDYAKKFGFKSIRREFGLSPASVGALNELRVASDLLLRGFNVYRSVSPSASCDLIAFRNRSQTIKIEVKTGYERGDRTYYPDTRDASLFDILAVVTTQNIHYIPNLPE